MSTFKNFVQCRVTSPIPAAADSIGLYAAVPPYTLPSEEGGLLVLTDSPTKPSKLEVISYTSRSELGLYGVTRGLEGTTALEWTGSVYCYQSLLAGEFKTLLDSKVDKVTGKGLSDENYTQDEKTKLAGLDTALDGKASITDSRLTDTREWSAATITQAEAESGTATTRKAWSSQRVRQAANSSIAAKNGIANGIASLDANAKIPLSQLSDSIIGQVEYMGVWAASANTPTLPTTPAEKGQYYVVNASGTQFGHSFAVGDWIISNGASWDKVDNTDAVSSVNGRTGNVTGLAESTDTRFADSREWTAATISQAEAEAGTATTRRAFTAQSVRQAIVAWAPATATRWPAFSEVTDKPATFTATAHTHPVSQVTGLGTAATKNVGTAVGQVINNSDASLMGAIASATVGDPAAGFWEITLPYKTNAGIMLAFQIKEYSDYYLSTIDVSGYLYSAINNWHGPQAMISAVGAPIVRFGMNAAGNAVVVVSSSSYSGIGIFNAVSGYGNAVNLHGTTITRHATLPSHTYVGSTTLTHYHTGNMPATATRWPTFDEVTGKPATYAPDAHTHTWDQVSGIPVTATRWPTAAEAGAAPASHTHDYLPLTGGTLTGSLSVTGDFVATGNVTAYSDSKLKENIEVIPDALAKISTLHGYTYNRKDIKDNTRHTGVIAQEVQKVLPEAVVEDEDGTLSVAYGNMVGLLIEAIKELKAEVDELKGVK